MILFLLLALDWELSVWIPLLISFGYIDRLEVWALLQDHTYVIDHYFSILISLQQIELACLLIVIRIDCCDWDRLVHVLMPHGGDTLVLQRLCLGVLLSAPDVDETCRITRKQERERLQEVNDLYLILMNVDGVIVVDSLIVPDHDLIVTTSCC